MLELTVFLSACAITGGLISLIDRFGGEQDYSGN
jgi:hypothetical protein